MQLTKKKITIFSSFTYYHPLHTTPYHCYHSSPFPLFTASAVPLSSPSFPQLLPPFQLQSEDVIRADGVERERRGGETGKEIKEMNETYDINFNFSKNTLKIF